ncbi:hypothetical protein DOK78_002363 [Enterococcus sp. DIV2402]|uniref:Tail tape measure chaperone protein n=1 Tax=Candidatus Enterococcus lowellii TaxID=2230877 RepID=A0ABZ2SPS5_9ENTE|nr:hypothetical protein [Enterococcus sp. DIV2402]MBO0463518.1 hypothetical protein [Enterococcus sp. DIV2402]
MAIKLQLKIDGKNRIFTQKTISARKMREMFKFYEKMEKLESEQGKISQLDVLDDMLILTENFFDAPEVNFDNLLDGIDAVDLMPTLQGVFEQVSEIGADEKKPTMKPA